MTNARMLWIVLVLGGCGGSYSTTPPPPPPPPPPGQPGGGNPTGVAAVAMSSISDGYGASANSFTPGSVTVTLSGTVTWTNSTGFVHNVTFAPAAGIPANIPDLPSGSASRTFATAGTFSYRCTNHSGMSGQVIVQ